MAWLQNLLAFAVTAGIVVLVHELGHFLVARACGVAVARFAIGFGKPLWVSRPDRHGTEWVIGSIWLGGYVRMVDDQQPRSQPMPSGIAFNRASPLARCAIVSAGPLANLLFAWTLTAALLLAGSIEPVATVSPPAAGTPAFAAGLVGGERIVAVACRDADWQPVRGWVDFDRLTAVPASSSAPAPLRLRVTHAGGRRALTLAGGCGTDREALGLVPAADAPVVNAVAPGMPAAAAGIRVGDRLLGASGLRWHGAADAIRALQQPRVGALVVDVARDNRLLAVALTPAALPDADGKIAPRIGVGLAANGDTDRVQYPFADAVWIAAQRTATLAAQTGRGLAQLVTGFASWSNLSGPVAIASHARAAAAAGRDAIVQFLALISVSIGMLNLLPVPVLDGGQLLYHGWELLTGRPVPGRLARSLQLIGVVLLFGLMALALTNDLGRLFGR